MAKKKIDKEAERAPSSPGKIVSIFKNETIHFVIGLMIRQHRGREPDAYRKKRQSRLRFFVGTFPMVLRKRPFHAVAAHGVQFTNLLRTAHIQHPFRYAGKPRQEKGQYDNELKTYIPT